MIAADRVIKWTTAGAVLGVAAVAAVASYEHAYDLVRAPSGKTPAYQPDQRLVEASVNLRAVGCGGGACT
jgi:hypothetical protein